MPSDIEVAANEIADALAPSPKAPAARWRWGTVKSVANDGTMSVIVGGSTMVGVRCAQHVMGAQVGDRVRVLYCGTEAMVDAVRASAKLMSLPTISSAIVTSADNIDRDGEAPSSTQYSKQVGVRDKDGEFVAYLQASQMADGTVRSGLLAAGEDGNGNAVYNGIYATVASDGTRGYVVSDSAAFRNAVNAVAAYDQSAMNAILQRFNGTGQMWGVASNVINSNNEDYYGKRVSLILEKDGIFAYNNTDSSSIWHLTGLSGTVDLGVTSRTLTANTSNVTTQGENYARSFGKVVQLNLVFTTKKDIPTWDNQNFIVGTMDRACAYSKQYMVAMCQINSNWTLMQAGINSSGEIRLRTLGTAIPSGTWVWVFGTYIST